MKKIVLIFLLTIISGVSVSCFEKQHREEEKPLTEDFSFVSSIRPNGINYNVMNVLLQKAALENGQDSVIQFPEKYNQRTPNFFDIEFFPVLTAEKLRDLSSTDFSKNKRGKYEDYIERIDFDTQFAFIVAHPEASPAYSNMGNGGTTIYTDNLFIKGEQDNTFFLDYDTSVFGEVPTGIVALYLKWNVKVFVFDKKKYAHLVVLLYNEEYHFDLLAENEESI